MAQAMGRFNFSPYLGEAKGIAGPVYLRGELLDVTDGWTTEDGSTYRLEQANRPASGETVVCDNLLLILPVRMA